MVDVVHYWAMLLSPALLDPDPVAMIREWFFSAPTPAQEAAGDFALEVDFDSHVRCVEMRPDRYYVAELDPASVTPSRDHFFVFYTFERHHLFVWGGLTVAALLALRPPGRVRRDEDLLWQPTSVSRCRGLASGALLGAMDVEPVRLSQWNPHLFLLPIFQEHDLDHEISITAEVFDVFFARLRWLQCPAAQIKPFSFQHHLLDKASFLLCAMVTPHLPSREAAMAYESRRLDRERWLFMQRMTPFLQSERTLLWLMAHNKALWSWFKERVVERCPEDEQAFTRLTGESTIPTLWFEVPLCEVPSRPLGREFPLHAGGVIHMPCHPTWTAVWLWDTYVLAPAQRRFSALCQRIPMALPPDTLGFELQMAVDFVSTDDKELPAPVQGGQPLPVDQRTGQPVLPVRVGDIEDIWKAAPPCVRVFREARGRFPGNWERVEMTQIFLKAFKATGIPEGWIGRFYELLNERFPRGGQSIRQRFNYKGAAKTWQGRETPLDPKSGFVWCRTLINRTLNRTDADRLGCPVAAQMLAARGGMRPKLSDQDEFAWRCGQECVAQTLPTRPAHWKPWRTPHGAMEEALRAHYDKKE